MTLRSTRLRPPFSRLVFAKGPWLAHLLVFGACSTPAGTDTDAGSTSTTAGTTDEPTGTPTGTSTGAPTDPSSTGDTPTTGHESATGDATTATSSSTTQPMDCLAPGDCAVEVPECRTAECVNGMCSFVDAPPGTPLMDPNPGDCQMVACDGGGQIALQPDPTDLDDGIACTIDACDEGVVSHTPDVQPCYAGPPETQDVGLCQPGVMTCDLDSGMLGPCEGEVLPQIEDCEPAHLDEDCDGQTDEDGASCVCGDGSVSTGETCDDGNAEDADACSSQCQAQAVLGRPGVGDSHVCALISGGRVKCWGTGFYGQLGLGDTSDRGDGPDEMGAALPAVDLGPGNAAVAVVAGEVHTCALLAGGTVRCWGYNQNGQLGHGDKAHKGDQADEMGVNLPTTDLGAGSVATAVSAGRSFTCALLEPGQVKCWGLNLDGQLGLGDTSIRGDGPGEMGDMLPVVDLGQDVKVVELATAATHVCARLDGGLVKCWGFGGVLGLGDPNRRGDQPGEMGDALPLVDLGPGVVAVRLVAGAGHTCAILADGKVKCWGFNPNGQLGLGDTQARGNQFGQMGDNLPTVDLGAGKTAIDLAAGQAFTCAVLGDGAVKCWGANFGGSLGLGDGVARGDGPDEMGDKLPTVDLGTGRTAVALDANVYSVATACARLDNSALKCWGANLNGKLGLGDTQPRGDGPGEMGDDLPTVKLFSAVW